MNIDQNKKVCFDPPAKHNAICFLSGPRRIFIYSCSVTAKADSGCYQLVLHELWIYLIGLQKTVTIETHSNF